MTMNEPAKKPIGLTAFLAAQRAAQESKAPVIPVPTTASIAASYADAGLLNINWNERQRQAITLGLQRKSFVLIGAAGTGKTTSLKGVVNALVANNLLPMLKSGTAQLLRETPGIAFVSYTRRAVRQIARQLPEQFKRHAVTIHKLLEFAPVKFEYEDAEGNTKTGMRFEPMRTADNPLPAELSCVVVDESSMVQYDPLFLQLKAACPADCQFIFLGDLHQLPPVYGEAVLANKLQELPVVELTEVYRQALDSPIIQIATDIKNGVDIPLNFRTVLTSPDGSSKVVINPWPKQISSEDALDAFATTIKNVINGGHFDEEEDIILMPFNKSCGTIELNLHIANTLGLRRGAVVHHIIAGYSHWYLAIGDRVLVDKQDCVIRGIERNSKYVGKSPIEPSTTLDRWGTYQDDKSHSYLESDGDIDALLEQMANSEIGDKVNQASHTLVLESLDTGAIFRVSDVGAFSAMVFSYALTVHKSQGSEWRRVFLFLHQSHHVMCSRELVYTAITRAREELIIVCEPDRRDSPGTLTRAARSPRIKGNTLEEKLEFLRERSKERLAKEEN